MIRQDYIMRMIEQLVKDLSEILFNKKTGNYQEAIKNIETAFNNILGLDYDLIKVLSFKDIISLLEISKDDALLNIKYIVIAKLLIEKADIENLSSLKNSDYVYRNDPSDEYQKILNLFLEGILNNKNTDIDLSSYYSEVKEIIKKLKDEIPEDTRLKLLNSMSRQVNETQQTGQSFVSLF